MRKLLVVMGLSVLSALVAYAHEGEDHLDEIPPHPTLPPCEEGDPDLLLPDLFPEVPGDVRTISRGTYRDMQFTTSVGNIGAGPLLLQGITVSTANGVFTAAYQLINRRDGSRCARVGGMFEFHPQHSHWHFGRFIGYELRQDDPYTGALVAGGEKASFCLLDIRAVRGYNPLQYPRQLTTQTCNNAESIVGISVGWEDVYERYLPGQSINLDPDEDHQVPVGGYFLVNHVNPDGHIWESNLDNNRSVASGNVSLSPRVLTGPPGSSPTQVPRPAPNPQRPDLRPGRIRPTRVPRPPRGGATVAPTPVPTRPRPVEVEPTRTRPAAPAPTPTSVRNTGSGGLRPPRPTRVPRTRPGDPVPVPTATPRRTDGPQPTSCDDACHYDVSQLRVTWYDTLGLTFQGFVSGRSSGCEPLSPEAGEFGMVEMSNWLNARKQNLGHDHSTTFVLEDGATGSTSSGGVFTVTPKSSGVAFSYTAVLPPPARTADGYDGFPVEFSGCLMVGDQAVKIHMVCQPKTQGLLCHEG